MDSLFAACIRFPFDLFKEHVLKHLCFVLQVGGNVEALDRRAELLEARRQDVLERIQADEALGKKPTHEVGAWLRDAEAVHQRAQSIGVDYDGRNCLFPGSCSCSLNCFSNHNVGSRAAQELSNVEAALQNAVACVGEITTVGVPPPAQAMPATALTDASGSEIRGKLQVALDFLRDDDQGALGLWGMGGVGKTTLLEHVNNSLSKHPSSSGFHRVVFLVASRDCTVGKIQELLVEKLVLNNSAQIFGYLSRKSFVLLLDDLWDPLDLKRAGVPLPLGAVGQFRRKLVVTTRFQQVCLNMDIHTIVEVECLSREAARRLFRDKVGEDAINSHPLIPKLADEVADECGGLPLALITIGRALAMNQTVQVWQNAARLLRDSKLSKIPGTVDPLPLLKFSYDHLKYPAEQQCFLHCALWPEDWEIDKEKLIELWMGHGLLGDDVDEIQDAYDQGYAMIDSLLKACLLQRVEPSQFVSENQFVKLHDVIRDMALWIARDCGKNENKWIVLKRGERLQHDSRVWSEVHKMSTSRGSIEGFPSEIHTSPELSTLIFKDSSVHAMGAIKHFSGLTYLDLSSCIGQGGLPIEIGSLIKLEYLNISWCPNVSSLPNELKNLRNLKYLGTTIRHLPEDLIADLVSLLHLDLTPSGAISQSSIIDDLSCGKGRLNALGISVSTAADIKKLVRQDTVRIRQLRINSTVGMASLRLLSSDVLGSEHMHSNLRRLCIDGCMSSIEELVVDEEHELTNLGALDLLCLSLKEVIWKGVEPQNVLPNLRNVHIQHCHLLEHVTWIVHLPFLERVDLGHCENMKHMVWVEALNTTKPYELGFPSLRGLYMGDLPNLDSICSSHDMLAFPSLEWLGVSRCARLTKLPFQSTPSLCGIKKICGDTEWWDNLKMDDDTRNFLQPFFGRVFD